MKALECSFCGKNQDQVSKLISSPPGRPSVYICEACVRICNSILNDDREPDPLKVVDRIPPRRIPLWMAKMFGGPRHG